MTKRSLTVAVALGIGICGIAVVAIWRLRPQHGSEPLAPGPMEPPSNVQGTGDTPINPASQNVPSLALGGPPQDVRAVSVITTDQGGNLVGGVVLETRDGGKLGVTSELGTVDIVIGKAETLHGVATGVGFFQREFTIESPAPKSVAVILEKEYSQTLLIESVTGEAVAGAVVEVGPNLDDQDISDRLISGTDGLVVIDGLTRSSLLHYSVSLDGFPPARGSFKFPYKPQTVRLLRDVIVSGIVTDHDGNAVPQATVWAYNPGEGWPLNKVASGFGFISKTDTEGRYDLWCREGKYHIKAIKVSSATMIPQLKKDVELIAIEEHRLDFSLRAGVRLEGQVVEAGLGKPVSAAYVSVYEGSLTEEDFPNGSPSIEAIFAEEANGTGRFSLGPLAADAVYSIRAARTDNFETGYALGVSPKSSILVPLVRKPEEPRHRVEGIVVESGSEGKTPAMGQCWAHLIPVGHDRAADREVFTSSAFSFSNVKPGRYQLEVGGSEYETKRTEAFTVPTERGIVVELVKKY